MKYGMPIYCCKDMQQVGLALRSLQAGLMRNLRRTALMYWERDWELL